MSPSFITEIEVCEVSGDFPYVEITWNTLAKRKFYYETKEECLGIIDYFYNPKSVIQPIVEIKGLPDAI